MGVGGADRDLGRIGEAVGKGARVQVGALPGALGPHGPVGAGDHRRGVEQVVPPPRHLQRHIDRLGAARLQTEGEPPHALGAGVVGAVEVAHGAADRDVVALGAEAAVVVAELVHLLVGAVRKREQAAGKGHERGVGEEVRGAGLGAGDEAAGVDEVGVALADVADVAVDGRNPGAPAHLVVARLVPAALVQHGQADGAVLVAHHVLGGGLGQRVLALDAVLDGQVHGAEVAVERLVDVPLVAVAGGRRGAAAEPGRALVAVRGADLALAGKAAGHARNRRLHPGGAGRQRHRARGPACGAQGRGQGGGVVRRVVQRRAEVAGVDLIRRTGREVAGHGRAGRRDWQGGGVGDGRPGRAGVAFRPLGAAVGGGDHAGSVDLHAGAGGEQAAQGGGRHTPGGRAAVDQHLVAGRQGGGGGQRQVVRGRGGQRAAGHGKAGTHPHRLRPAHHGGDPAQQRRGRQSDARLGAGQQGADLRAAGDAALAQRHLVGCRHLGGLGKLLDGRHGCPRVCRMGRVEAVRRPPPSPWRRSRCASATAWRPRRRRGCGSRSRGARPPRPPGCRVRAC